MSLRTSREQVLMALGHKEPDCVRIDFLARNSIDVAAPPHMVPPLPPFPSSFDRWSLPSLARTSRSRQ